jgi:light-regulated signal transduction histidine kinase (bacteriophytochrome)
MPLQTFTNCEDEPIRIPGSIQRHGFLLLLDQQNQQVVAASDNAEDFLKIPLKLILGTPLDTILDREVLAAMRPLLNDDETTALPRYLGSFRMRGELYSVVTHRVNAERVVEFERLDRLVSPELMNAVITNFVGTLGKVNSETELLQAIVKQVKELTGFSRVLLYRFDEAGHGTVLGEQNDGTLPSYLHLRFPASDIPAQARELYLLNTVRIIPNASYVPSPLQGVQGRSMEGLDLSLSLLRSVSPVHLEYMRNMGTLSSMSISIVCEGKLWGLISGHHASTHSVPYLVRSACDLLTKMVSSQLMALRNASRLEAMVGFHAVQRKMLTQMAAANDYVGAMLAQMQSLTKVTDAQGVALIIEDRCHIDGVAPGEGAVRRLAAWMDTQPDLKVFESRHLQQHLAWTKEIEEVASGLLAIRISDVRQSYILWFRPEVISTVLWAGEPVQELNSSQGLHPRASFNSWKELVRGQSAPWTEMEIDSARDFRAAVMTISLKRAEEAVEFNAARFEQLTNSLPNPVWTANDDGQLAYVNRKWRDQGFGSNGFWYKLLRLAPEEEIRCAELWLSAVAKSAPFEAEVRLRARPNEVERWYLVRAIPIPKADRTRGGWVGTCTDLTDQRDRETAQRRTEKLELTGRMTSVIAHEINNPLEAITNLLYLLKNEVDDSGHAKNYIGMAQYELDRISGITKQTLRWSNESVEKTAFSTAGALFDDVLHLFAGKMRNRQITVTVTGGRDLAVFGVIGQLKQVVANLFTNALDAVPLGGQVWLEAISRDGMTEIVVRDQGSGMSEATLSQIFEPFYSTKGDLGNGLGLYISKELVERHGGRLLVESKLGSGTTMRMCLPQAGSVARGCRQGKRRYSED